MHHEQAEKAWYPPIHAQATFFIFNSLRIDILNKHPLLRPQS
jgi:hypothetical protein